MNIEITVPEGISFPIIKKNKKSGYYVLFTSLKTGLDLTDSKYSKKGSYSESLIDCTDSYVWEDVPTGTKVEFIQ